MSLVCYRYLFSSLVHVLSTSMFDSKSSQKRVSRSDYPWRGCKLCVHGALRGSGVYAHPVFLGWVLHHDPDQHKLLNFALMKFPKIIDHSSRSVY